MNAAVGKLVYNRMEHGWQSAFVRVLDAERPPLSEAEATRLALELAGNSRILPPARTGLAAWIRARRKRLWERTVQVARRCCRYCFWGGLGTWLVIGLARLSWKEIAALCLSVIACSMILGAAFILIGICIWASERWVLVKRALSILWVLVFWVLAPILWLCGAGHEEHLHPHLELEPGALEAACLMCRNQEESERSRASSPHERSFPHPLGSMAR